MSAGSSNAPRVVVLGGINTDYVVRSRELPKPGQSVQGEGLFTGAGGKGANQAVAAARLGARVALIGRVGDEPRGRELARGLQREKVDTRHLSFDRETPSGAAIIAVDASGEKQISAALGANMGLKPQQIREAEELIAQANVLLANFEMPVGCVLEAALLAKKHGVKFVLDPAPPTKFPNELLKLVYAIRPNSDEAGQITGVKVKDRASARRAAKMLLERGVQVAVLQAGSEGDLLVSADEEIFVPRLKMKTVDATGAGDAFAGGLAVAIGEGMAMKEAARFANACAAIATTKMGAQEAMPRRAQVRKLLRKAG